MVGKHLAHTDGSRDREGQRSVLSRLAPSVVCIFSMDVSVLSSLGQTSLRLRQSPSPHTIERTIPVASLIVFIGASTRLYELTHPAHALRPDLL